MRNADIEYGRKGMSTKRGKAYISRTASYTLARHLRALIRHATGLDITAFSGVIQHRLDTLAKTAAILGLDSGSTASISAALSKLSSDQLQVQLHLVHLKIAEEELRAALALARHRQGVVAS